MKLENIKLKTDYLNFDEEFFHKVKPMPLKGAFLISANAEIAKLLNIDIDELSSKEFVEFVNGNTILEGSEPFAMCYAGHQFGYYVPRLGDGRAINLGELNGWHLQLKGSGLTRYSREGDGRAVLRSSIREYLMSEAMHALGVPTTRALAVIGSNENIARERWEKGAIVLRVSSSWIRFGTFEYFYYKKRYEKLEQLADYVLKQSFSEYADKENRYILMYEEIVKRTAHLMAYWQSIGFSHGVMNTDNMSIAGLTIDYGPYSFLDDYDFDFICNHTDVEGRYSFGNQPNIGYWNLSMLLKALSPLINMDKGKEILEKYPAYFTQKFHSLMCAKLGISESKEHSKLIQWLFNIMQNDAVDYTLFFRTLSEYNDRSEISKLFISDKRIVEWLEEYEKELPYKEGMKRVNPKYVLKNYMLQEAIEKAEIGDYSLVDSLLKIAQDPYEEHAEFNSYAKATPHQLKALKLSCSS
ncbi:YdiU family protein [bacterium]|nr:YdiU family protein [bacterium]